MHPGSSPISCVCLCKESLPLHCKKYISVRNCKTPKIHNNNDINNKKT